VVGAHSDETWGIVKVFETTDFSKPVFVPAIDHRLVPLLPGIRILRKALDKG